MSDTPPQDPWAQPGAAQQPPEEQSAPEAVPPAPSYPPPPPAPSYPPPPPAPSYPPPPPAPSYPPPSYPPPGSPPPSYPPPPGYPPPPPLGGDAGYPAPAGQLIGWWRRVGATLIDGLVFVIPYFILIVAIGGAGAYLLYLIANGAYLVGMLAKRGQTLGNMALSSRVVDARTGQAPSYGKAAIRWLVEILLGLTGIGGLLDYLWPLWDNQNQTLHDKAAGTLVVSSI